MDLNTSYEIGDSTLQEIERQENEMNLLHQEAKNSECLDVIEGSPTKFDVSSIQHQTLSSRMKVATQRLRQLKKSNNDSKIDLSEKENKLEISCVSKYINTDSDYGNFNFSAWEKSMEKLCSPAPKLQNSKIQELPEVLKSDYFNTSEDEKIFDIDNVTFIESQKEELYKFNGDNLCIENNQSVLSIKSRTSFIHTTNNSLILNTTKNLEYISNWNLPDSVVNEYRKKGVEKMFQWQTECLQNSKVIFDSANLVYSAPTSAGKTLVSEILMIKNIIERKKKALFILPFVSLVREKIYFLQVF
jgi:CRISPR/Cas system-associated endonuclease/helicase Cas3